MFTSKKPKTVSRKNTTHTQHSSPKKSMMKISHYFQVSKSTSILDNDRVPPSNVIQENKRKATDELNEERSAKLKKKTKIDVIPAENIIKVKGVNSDVIKAFKDESLICDQSIESLVIDSKKTDEDCDNRLFESQQESIPENDELFSEFFEDEWDTSSNIDLNSFLRCKIEKVGKEKGKMVLNVKSANSENYGVVECSGFWINEEVKESEVVMIQAKKQTDHWIIDNNHGFLVSKPDFLISATTVASSIFCQRKTVLCEKFRKMESLPCSKEDQSWMAVGKIVHQLLQQCLQMEIHALPDIFKAADNILNSSWMVKILYECNTTLNKFKEQVYQYVHKIFQFIQHYIKGTHETSIQDIKSNFEGKIEKIHDIEENFWLPQMGIKGKIDVTVEVNINSTPKLLPLEMKTGRPSFSLEHKGQLILYSMMMDLVGHKTDIGLLLYLKDNAMQKVTSTHHERRDIIILRNKLAHYLANNRYKQGSISNPNELDSSVELPEPIHHPTACSKCPFNTLCCVYLAKDKNTKLSPSHPINKLTHEILSNLKPSHIDYVLKWISLLDIEEMSHENQSANTLWMKTPEEREKHGNCISNLKIIKEVVLQSGRYQHVLGSCNSKEKPMNELELSENDYVMLSTKTRVNIASGFVMYVKPDCIAINMDKDLTKRYDKNNIFHVDKYPSTSLFSFSFANVAGLLNHNEMCNKLRRIIIDREPATFSEKLPRSILSICTEIIRGLNEYQQRAILKCLLANEYILIKGMPGTGKTQTLVALIQILNKIGSSVLITAHTHSAVDNILLRLTACEVDFLRLGSVSNIHPKLTQYSEESLSLGCDSAEALDAAYKSKNIVAVTCFGAYHVLLQKRTFDVCIVDESTQVIQPAILRPLYSAKKFILIGDPEQLQPLAKSFIARKLGATQSLFSRLDSENNSVILKLQYRMNMKIMSLANSLTYKNQLETDNQSVANATVVYRNAQEFDSCAGWIKTTLSCSMSNAVMMLNTGCTRDLNIENVSTLELSKNSNIWEAAIVLHLLKALVMMGIDAKNIGIITPFKDQVKFLKGLLKVDVEINTVDQYQGRDKDIIIFSCSKNLRSNHNRTKENEILEDHERLTVAVTRAKLKLIIIGDRNTLIHFSPFKKLFESLKSDNILNLVEGCHDFSWKKVIEILE